MSFSMPEVSDWAKEQNNHAATKEYMSEIYDVVRKHGARNALEIGCIWGVSTVTILHAAPATHLLSVDPIPQLNPSMHAMTEVRFNKLQNRWDYFTGKSSEFWSQNKDKYDLIYIDGSHNYEDVKLDLFSAWICLKKGGLLLTDDYLHDHNHDSDYGVSLAVLELMQQKQITPVHMGKHCIGFKK